MPSPNPQQERRRAVRALASFSVRLTGKAEAGEAQLRDISEIGLACASPVAIPEMTLVALDFALPGQTERHQVKGAVVRCDKLPRDPSRYDLAVYFTEITPVTRAALRGYVAKAKRAP